MRLKLQESKNVQVTSEFAVRFPVMKSVPFYLLCLVTCFPGCSAPTPALGNEAYHAEFSREVLGPQQLVEFENPDKKSWVQSILPWNDAYGSGSARFSVTGIPDVDPLTPLPMLRVDLNWR